ncbi:hypothetical protein E4T56_gene736 [Termitomyces sp. T112]|nr:hypothetical protein E4T56_gene736 [Termitomyces sp. T112]
MTVLYPSKFPIFHYPNTVGPYIGAVIFELFLYGIYFVLFFSYIAILLHRRRVRWIQILSAFTMFGITSADVVYTLDLLFKKLLVKGLEYEELRPKYIMYVVNSVIADILLLYKFYLIWNSNKWMLVGPGFLLAVATGCGFAFEGTSAVLSQFSWINISMTVILNVVVTSLMGGSILF